MKKLVYGFGQWCIDAGERALRAAIVTFTSLTAGASIFGLDGAVDLGFWKRAGIAAIGSATSVVMSLAAKWAGGDPATASFTKDPPPHE